MGGQGLQRLGLVLRSGPLHGRSNRQQLDTALAAAALGVQLDLFFIGDGVQLILAARDGAEAGLPSQAQAWRSLAELTEVRAVVEEARWTSDQKAGLQYVLAAEPMMAGAMATAQQGCDLVMVL